MPERIIYCALSCASFLSGVAHNAVQRVDSAVVASVSDDVLLKLLAKEPRAPILYFSRSDYDRAMKGLSTIETEAVIRKRLSDWAPNVLDQAMDALYLRQRQSLTLTALAQQESRGTAAAAKLDDYFQRILRLLAEIVGDGRYGQFSLASQLVLVVEGDAALRDEYIEAEEAAQREADTTEMGRWKEAANSSERYLRSLGASLNKLGRPEFAESLPHVSLNRGLFVSPRDPQLIRTLQMQRQAYVDWKEGLVTRWASGDSSRLEAQGKQVRLLYFNSGRMLEDFDELTRAQLEREFAERIKSGGSIQSRTEHIYALWLEQDLLRRAVLARAEKEDGAAAVVLKQQVVEESTAFSKALASHPVWLDNETVPDSNTLDALRRNEEGIAEDIRFLTALCQVRGETHLGSRFASILAIKEQDIRELPASHGH